MSTEQSEPDLTKQFDVIIIGSGAGGSISAAHITKMGLSVLMIEEGKVVRDHDFNQNESQMVREMYRYGGALATDDMSIKILQGKVWGGSTTINWMNCFRTPENVLIEWEDKFGLEQYTNGTLKPIFEGIEKRMSVHEVISHNPQNQLIEKGCEALGIESSNCHNNSKECIECGKCGLGCSYNAKQDMRMTYLSDAVSAGLQFITRHRVEKIKYIDLNTQKVLCTNLMTGETLTVSGKRTIISAGAIFTPLILQRSGLINSKTLGNFLHLHPVVASLGIYSDKKYPTYGAPQTKYSDQNITMNENYGFWQEAPDLEVFLAGVNFPGMGKERREKLKMINNSAVIITLTRDGSDYRSHGSVKYIRGFNSQTGMFSLKKQPSIRYKPSEKDFQTMLEGLKNAIKIHFAAGALEVTPLHSSGFTLKKESDISTFFKYPMKPNTLTMFSAHPTGTARIGVSHQMGTVTEGLELHDYPGVFVMDGSVLPTAPGVNPMITILAVIKRGLQVSEDRIQ